MQQRQLVPGLQRSARACPRPHLAHSSISLSSARRRCAKANVGVELRATVQQEDEQAAQGRVRLVRGMLEMQQVARLRAEAYYQDDNSRFVESFKKKFAAGEADSLEQRTAPLPASGAPLVECLVVVEEVPEAGQEEDHGMEEEDDDNDTEASTSTSTSGSPRVVGCIDIRLPRTATGRHPVGVPDDDTMSSYILNVVVDEEQRGRGIGKMLMKSAMQRAVDKWASQRLYTHVAADNDVALRLYTGCGFKEYSVDAQALEGGSVLGKLLLLCANAADVPRN